MSQFNVHKSINFLYTTDPKHLSGGVNASFIFQILQKAYWNALLHLHCNCIAMNIFLCFNKLRDELKEVT